MRRSSHAFTGDEDPDGSDASTCRDTYQVPERNGDFEFAEAVFQPSRRARSAFVASSRRERSRRFHDAREGVRSRLEPSLSQLKGTVKPTE